VHVCLHACAELLEFLAQLREGGGAGTLGKIGARAARMSGSFRTADVPWQPFVSDRNRKVACAASPKQREVNATACSGRAHNTKKKNNLPESRETFQTSQIIQSRRQQWCQKESDRTIKTRLSKNIRCGNFDVASQQSHYHQHYQPHHHHHNYDHQRTTTTTTTNTKTTATTIKNEARNLRGRS